MISDLVVQTLPGYEQNIAQPVHLSTIAFYSYTLHYTALVSGQQSDIDIVISDIYKQQAVQFYLLLVIKKQPLLVNFFTSHHSLFQSGSEYCFSQVSRSGVINYYSTISFQHFPPLVLFSMILIQCLISLHGYWFCLVEWLCLPKLVSQSMVHWLSGNFAFAKSDCQEFYQSCLK